MAFEDVPSPTARAARRVPAAAALIALAAAACAAPPDLHAASARPRAPAVRNDDAPDIVTYGQREDVMRFADDVSRRRGLDAERVRATLAQARFQPPVAKYIMPPAAGTAKNWAAYRARFIDPSRIRAGAAFWRDNERWLNKAEADYGVPAQIVVGIVGVETIYGRQMGSFRVLDALATLAFDFPGGRSDRSAFFRDELEALLSMTAKADAPDPLLLRGSYAGAFGLPQFMPSSFLKYAVDFDGDGRIDLLSSAADAIGSVAAYLAAFGWQRGLPTHYGVAAPTETVDRALMLVPDILPTFTAAQFAEHGARLDEAGRGHAGPLALVELQNGDAAPSYVAGTANFYVVTRYNRSSYYALAVIELGAAVAAER